MIQGRQTSLSSQNKAREAWKVPEGFCAHPRWSLPSCECGWPGGWPRPHRQAPWVTLTDPETGLWCWLTCRGTEKLKCKYSLWGASPEQALILQHTKNLLKPWDTVYSCQYRLLVKAERLPRKQVHCFGTAKVSINFCKDLVWSSWN